MVQEWQCQATIEGKVAVVFRQPERTIVLIAQDLSHWPVAELAASASRAAGSSGYRFVSLDFHRSAERERTVLEMVAEAEVAGAIFLWDHHSANLDLYRRLTRTRPCVQVVDPKPIPDLDFVGIDDYRGGQLAVHHLLGLGYRRIGHATLTPCLTGVRDRERAYEDSLRAAGLTPRSDWTLALPYGFAPGDRAERARLSRAFLMRPSRPKSLFACADWVASEIVESAYDLGLDIPGDLVIVGYDDSLPYSQTGLPLTSVRIDARQIGRLAVERLIQRREGSVKAPACCLLPPLLVVRESSVGLLAAAERWEAGTRYIEDNYRDGISAGDVAAVVGLEPNYFSHRFRSVFGRRFTDYVQELRLRHATELLETTDGTVEGIAIEAGFRSLNHFYTLFRRAHQLSPHAYRRLQAKGGEGANFSA